MSGTCLKGRLETWAGKWVPNSMLYEVLSFSVDKKDFSRKHRYSGTEVTSVRVGSCQDRPKPIFCAPPDGQQLWLKGRWQV